MEATEKKPKSLIPRKAQIPMILVGVPVLLYVMWGTATQMGWVGKPPHAKPVQTAKQPAEGPGGPAAAHPAGPTATATPTPGPAPGPRGRAGPATDLSALRAPSRDPMAQLGTPATPPKPPVTPPPPGSAAPPQVLPGPTSTPGATGEFPSPTTGAPPAIPPGALPMPVTLQARPLPSALGASYPMARRGTRAEAGSPNVTLMGTISGSRGSMAVVHPGETTRGQYLTPGQTLAGVGSRIESIEGGKVTLGGRGGSRELLLRPHHEAPPPKPEAAAPKVEGAPDVGAKPD